MMKKYFSFETKPIGEIDQRGHGGRTQRQLSLVDLVEGVHVRMMMNKIAL